MTTLSPSILSADFSHLGADCRMVLDAGAQMLHYDVMDGHFVPNISFGVPVLKSLHKALPDAFYDVHLMITHPQQYAEAFAKAGASLVDAGKMEQLLALLAKEQPQIKLLSAAGEQVLEKKEAEKAARKLPELSKDAQHSLTVLKKAKEYLEAKPEIAEELSAAERRKRAQLKSKPVYKYVALIISLFGVVAAAYGIHSLLTHSGNYGIYFALFGFAAIFLFSSYNMMPTARNNNSAIMKRAEKAEAAMADYLKPYPHGTFPVPSQYAHPVVLKQMMDAVEEGRAVTVPEALEAVKNRLREVNADVQVEQEEYDEVVVIKAMFLNHDYQ